MIVNTYNIFIVVADTIQLLVWSAWLFLEAFYRFFISRARKCIVGEIALVTGAAHGMGKEMALKLSEQGAIVVCWDISQDGLNETVKEIEEGGGKAVGDVVDVSDREQVLAAAQRVRDQVGDVTMLFNNAGIISCKPLLQHSHKELHRIFNVNVFSQFYTLEAFLPQMLEMKKGHVIAMSSAAGVQGAAFIVPYSSSKFAVTGLMDSLHEEVRYSHSNSNVKFTTVHPFIVSTGLVQAPRIRFNSLTPITSPKKAVETIIDGVLRDREVIFVPSYGEILYRVAKVWPVSVKRLCLDFLDAGVKCEN